MAEAKKKQQPKEKETENGSGKETDQTAPAAVEKQEVKPSGEAEASTTKEKPTAKAGKRSAKAVAEAEEKQAKAQRKAAGTDENAEAKPKKAVKPARSLLERRSKGYRKSAQLVDKTKQYSLAEAVELAKKTSSVKFDATVELHINLNVDPKQADQNIRGTTTLPAGTGKTVNVAVADDDLLAKLDKGQIDFDVLVATPDFMPKLGKYAKLLGPRGLMPNPKSGTVATDVKKAVEEAKAGRVEYRVDSTGIIHTAFGKVSFSAADLQKNAGAVIDAVKAAKPASIKGVYIKSMYITTTMGPSVKLQS
jgi:large subunit ribosomal protein L1